MRGKIYPMDTLWIPYRGFRAVKNGPHPGENRQNFSHTPGLMGETANICTIFAVKKGNICTKQRPWNNGHTRNNVMDTPGTVYLSIKMGENRVEAQSISAYI